MIRPRLVAPILVVLAGCSSEVYLAQLKDGDVVRLVDAPRGHEVVLEKAEGKARMRLVGIYAFDMRTPESELRTLAEASRAFMLAKKGQSLTVHLEREAPDSRGRFLGFLSAEGEDLGRTLITQGNAAVYTEFPFSRESDYIAADEAARTAKLGIWSSDVGNSRMKALRTTWASVREREHGSRVSDPVLAGGAK